MNILVLSFITSHTIKQGAGNNSHIYNMTKYLQNLGHKIYFVYVDTGVESYNLQGMRDEWDYVEVIKNNNISHFFKKKTKFDFAYTEELGNAIVKISKQFGIQACIFHYFLFSKVFELLPSHIIKIIDTHDIFTNRYKFLGKNLIPKEFFNLSQEHERRYLDRADIIVTRTEADRNFFNKLTNSHKSLTLTYFNLNNIFLNKEYTNLTTIGFVGSNNLVNIICILKFLKVFDKEYVKGNLQNVKIEIVGSVLSNIPEIHKLFSLKNKIKLFLNSISLNSFLNIFRPNLAKYLEKYVMNREYFKNTGFVESLDDFYSRVDLIISPIIFGTGVNIKTAEALSKGVPIVSTTNGFKGFISEKKEHNAKNFEEMILCIKELSVHPEKLQELSLSSKNIFSNYLKIFQEYFLKLFTLKYDQYKPIFFPIFSKPKVSIIIPVFNNIELILNCCNAILDNTTEIPYEVIIVDDGSTDEIIYLDSYIKNAKILRNKENLGYIKSCNLASEAAAGEYMVLLNNDTLVQKDWLKYILKTFEIKKDAGIVGGMLLNPDGSIQEAGCYICVPNTTGLINTTNSPVYCCEYLKSVGYVSGACLCIATKLFFNVGKLDEMYGKGYAEDPDLCMKVREVGYEVYFQPKAKIIHLGSQTFGINNEHHSYMKKNNELFFHKWDKSLQLNCCTVSSNPPHPSEIFLARNNSKHKKTILCFDELIPSIYHGGGRSSLCYLKTFLKMGLNVKFFPEIISASDKKYIENLQQMGIEIIYPREELYPFLEANGKYINYIFLQRPYSYKYIYDLRKYTKAKLLYYGHDLHFLRTKRQFDFSNKKVVFKLYKSLEKQELQLVQEVDIAYYPSILEVNLLKDLFPKANIHLLNSLYYNTSDLDILYNKTLSTCNKLILFVGSMHHPNVEGLIWFIENIWDDILLQHKKEIYLKVVGNIKLAFDNNALNKFNNNNIIFLGNISEKELVKVYKEANLAINPGFVGAGLITKVIEAIYYRTPIVSTSIATEGFCYDYKDLIYVASDKETFIKCINNLLDPKYIYNEEKAKQFIDSYFSQDIIIKQLNKGLADNL